MNIKQLNEKIQKFLNEEAISDGKSFSDFFGEDLTGQTYKGNLKCNEAELTSLKGSPEIVNGSFSCSGNNLTSLAYAPRQVEAFYCQNNNLTTLEGAPEFVDSYFNCSNNPLISFKGLPKKIEHLVAEGLDYRNLDLDELSQYDIKKISPKPLEVVVKGLGFEAVLKRIVEAANAGYKRYATNRRNKGTSFDVPNEVLGYFTLEKLDFRNRKYESKLTSNNTDFKVLNSVQNSINKRFNPFTLSINQNNNYVITW